MEVFKLELDDLVHFSSDCENISELGSWSDQHCGEEPQEQPLPSDENKSEKWTSAGPRPGQPTPTRTDYNQTDPKTAKRTEDNRARTGEEERLPG